MKPLADGYYWWKGKNQKHQIVQVEGPTIYYHGTDEIKYFLLNETEFDYADHIPIKEHPPVENL